MMIVESGWGSMIPTAIIAHLAKDGAAAKSGQLNVGDQILAVNGTSFVGLPLTDCQTAIKVGSSLFLLGPKSADTQISSQFFIYFTRAEIATSLGFGSFFLAFVPCLIANFSIKRSPNQTFFFPTWLRT